MGLILPVISNLFRCRKKRPLRAIQVEVTSRCTRSCIICPRSGLAQNWRSCDLKDDVWKVIAPDLHLAEHIHLQGWGEPLLHRMLPIWAAKAREAGCTVGITTNGDLLDSAAEWLLEGNVDLLTVSAGGGLKTNESLRGGSKLDQILDSAGRLAARSRETGLRMKVQLSYLLICSNISDLPNVVELAARAGLEEIFIIHLDCRVTKPLYELTAYNDDNIPPEAAVILKAAEKTARRSGIRFRGPTLRGEEVLACALNPLYFTFIACDGRVGPCVNLLLPIEGRIPRWSKRGVTLVEPVVYGRLEQTPLSDLLASKERERFITPFRERLAAEERFKGVLDKEPSIRTLRELDSIDEKRTGALIANSFPKACVECPKARAW